MIANQTGIIIGRLSSLRAVLQYHGLCDLDRGFSWSGLAVICRAESRQGHPGWEDRSGPGNDKSTYECKTGRVRQADVSLFFSTDSLLQAQSLAYAAHFEDRDLFELFFSKSSAAFCFCFYVD